MREEDGPFAFDEVVEVDVPVCGLGLEVGGDGTETQPERTSQYASVESTAQYLLVSQEASVFCHMHTHMLAHVHSPWLLCRGAQKSLEDRGCLSAGEAAMGGR